MIRQILTMLWNRKGKNALLITEIFLSFLILFSVLTFVLYNIHNYKQPLGFVTTPLWLCQLQYEGRDSLKVVEMKKTLQRELNALPEIEQVAFSFQMTPFGNSNWTTGHDANGFELSTSMFFVDENFGKTVGVNLVEGRWFTKDDALSKYTPVVISKKMHEDTFKGKPVLDSVYTISDDNEKIVGIIDHFKYRGQFKEEVPMTFVYRNSGEEGSNVLYLRLKEGVGIEYEESLTKAIAQIGKFDDILLEQVETRRLRRNREIWVPIIALLSICGFLIFNVALGLFGVLWYNISKRKSEIGLRRAMGAFKSTIAWQFIIEIVVLALVGILLGIVFGLQVPFLNKFDIADTFFYQAMALSTLIILVLVVICAFYPSQQAARIAPATALHEE